MSFFCPWQDARFEKCRRTGDTECRPAKPGCVLFARDVAKAPLSPPPEVLPGRRPSRERRLERFEFFPQGLAAWLTRRDMPLDRPLREGGWTPAQVVHHLADVHAAGLARVRRALTEDSPRVEPYDHEAWARLPDAAEPALVPASLEALDGTHRRWATLLRGISSLDWKRGYRQPELGGRLITVEQDLDWHLAHGEEHQRALEI